MFARRTKEDEGLYLGSEDREELEEEFDSQGLLPSQQGATYEEGTTYNDLRSAGGTTCNDLMTFT